MNKVGIVTTAYGNNFGEALQAFAMRKAINTYCDDCAAELVRFICFNQVNRKKPGFSLYYKDDEKKNRLFEKFRHDEIGMNGIPARHLEDDSGLDFDCYVFGSDQIWNTDAWEIPEFFGSFVPARKKKIAYAASIGLWPNNPSLKRALFEEYIDTFDYLSVRESMHCDFLRQFTDKPVEFVADPTLLLKTKIYEELMSSDNAQIPERPYIFYYQPHSADGAIVSLVNKIARREHMDVVHTFAEIPANIFPYASYSARFLGPKEFLYYLSHAALVITRSYHAVIFSILFQKPFYAFVDKKTGTRFESILHHLGLKDRLIYEYIEPYDVDFSVNYADVNRRLELFRMDSIAYLKNALNT